MRVWAMASWGSLLALSACSSTDQTGPLSSPANSQGEATPAGETSPSPRVEPTTAQTLARPETALARPRVTRPLGQSPRTRTQPTRAATTPSAQDLRARVDQVRQQRAQTPQPSQPSSLTVQPAPQPPSPQKAVAPPQVVFTPTDVRPLPSPVPVSPGPQVLSRPEGSEVPTDSNFPSQAASAGAQPAIATSVRPDPTPAARHQGYSAQIGNPKPVLTPRPPSTQAQTASAPVFRGQLHGQAAQPLPVPTEQAAIATPSLPLHPESPQAQAPEPLPDTLLEDGDQAVAPSSPESASLDFSTDLSVNPAPAEDSAPVALANGSAPRFDPTLQLSVGTRFNPEVLEGTRETALLAQCLGIDGDDGSLPPPLEPAPQAKASQETSPTLKQPPDSSALPLCAPSPRADVPSSAMLER